MTEYHFLIGKGRQSARLAESLNVARLIGREMSPLADPVAELRRQLAKPQGSPPLAELASGQGDAVIVVSDYTRYVAYPTWLPALLDELNSAGLPDSALALYVASGTHRGMTDAEKLAAYGHEVLARVKVLDHDCDALERMHDYGTTSRGTPVLIDNRVAEAGLLIISGGIQYHYFAGYSAGRKALLPGCAARESILVNHQRVIDAAAGDFAKGVLPGSLATNPVHQDMLEGARLIEPHLTINLAFSDSKQTSWLGVGEHSAIHAAGTGWLDQHNRIELAEPADVMIISSGGAPKDTSLFQSHKALKHSEHALRPGAKVIWLAECTEGEGVAAFAAQRALSLAEVQAEIAREVSLYAFASLSMKQLTSRYDVYLVSDLPAETVRAWGMSPAEDLTAALTMVEPQVAPDARWLVAPDMSNLLPVVVAE